MLFLVCIASFRGVLIASFVYNPTIYKRNTKKTFFLAEWTHSFTVIVTAVLYCVSEVLQGGLAKKYTMN